ncbi:MAG: PH domain-containing protein [Planctomycetota bacterium]
MDERSSNEPVKNEPAGRVSDPPPDAPVDRAAAAGLPPDFGPEQRVLWLRPAMFRAKPFSFMGLSLVLLASVVGAVVLAFETRTFWLNALLVVCGLAFLAAGITLLVWWIHTMGASLEVTTKRTTERRGLFSRATSEVLHDNIRNIQVDQSFIQRIFDVGAIGISSSGQDGIEVSMKHIRDPHGVRGTIDKYRPL